MPKRDIIIINCALGPKNMWTENLLEKLSDGWQLDSTVYSSSGVAKPMVAESYIVYHLIKYSEEEQQAMQEALIVPERKIVDYHRTNDSKLIRALIRLGKWTIKEDWSKETLLYLYDDVEDGKDLETVIATMNRRGINMAGLSKTIKTLIVKLHQGKPLTEAEENFCFSLAEELQEQEELGL